MAKYFKFPFGIAGDRGSIPDVSPPDGSVSFTDGFGVNYQLDPGTDSDALDVPRLQFNQLIYDITLAIKQYQEHGFPDFITTADNGGTPHEYGINDHVRYDDGSGMKCYYSLVDGNLDTPPSAKWGIVVYSQGAAPGTTEIWPFVTIKDGGYLWMNGTTIGNASSNGTQRANADTQTVYTKIWTDYSNTICPIFDSAGIASIRGISAATDYAANKALSMPDWCGRGLFGMDNMGGITAKGRITVPLSGISGTTLGASGGAQSVQLSGNQNGTHTHVASTASAGAHTHTGTTDSAGAHSHVAIAGISDNGGLNTNLAGYGNIGAPYSNTTSIQSAGTHAHTFTTNSSGSHTHDMTVNNSGLGSDHQNMPPAVMCGGFIMKL